MEKQKSDLGSIIKWIDDMTNVISQHGIIKVISSIFTLAIAILVLTITINPNIIFDKFFNYQQQIESENRDFRKNNDPLIREELKDLMYKINAERVSVLEFHNGRKNPSSLGFYYAEMTYEQTAKNIDPVSLQYRSINLSLHSISTTLYTDAHWHGHVDELACIDTNIATAIHNNGINYIGLLLLEGDTELGILVVSFIDEPNWIQVDRDVRRSSVKITTWLDYNKKKK